MKLPFYTFLGPILRRYRRNTRHICSSRFLCISSYYTPILGFIGVILSLMDLVRIIRCGSVLPIYLLKERKSGVVSAEAERDFKLISLVISFEYYLLIILGYFSRNAVLFLPFLFLYAFIALMELINVVMRILTRTISVSKSGLILACIVAYNWFAVFCTFYRLICSCDYY